MKQVFFFEGQVKAYQPDTGYRAGTDTLLLAASLDCKSGSHVLELGTGSAAAILMANHRLENCRFTGMEKQEDMLEIARENTNDYENIEIVKGDVNHIPKTWNLQFDHVFANPPFFDEASAVRMSKAKAASFVAGPAKLMDWIAAMFICLKARGIGSLIYRADGLEAILAALYGKAGNIRILPVHSYSDEPAKRVIIQFRKGVKSASELLPALVLHDRGNAETFTQQVRSIVKGEGAIKL